MLATVAAVEDRPAICVCSGTLLSSRRWVAVDSWSAVGLSPACTANVATALGSLWTAEAQPRGNCSQAVEVAVALTPCKHFATFSIVAGHLDS